MIHARFLPSGFHKNDESIQNLAPGCINGVMNMPVKYGLRM